MVQYLTPIEQTVKLCYINYLPPFAVHGTLLLTYEDIFERSREYKNILLALRDVYFGSDDISSKIHMNDTLA